MTLPDLIDALIQKRILIHLNPLEHPMLHEECEAIKKDIVKAIDSEPPANHCNSQPPKEG